MNTYIDTRDNDEKTQWAKGSDKVNERVIVKIKRT